MTPTRADPPMFDKEERLVEALAEFHAAIETEGNWNRDDFLGRYPDLASELAGYLDSFEFIHSVTSVFPRTAPWLLGACGRERKR